ncbi:MAG: RbsD/FucU family protein [Myxococcota bacterium]
MLKHRLIHPQLIGALATAGHGSQVLLADANYPFATGVRVDVERVYLNLAPDMLRVTDVLSVLLDSIEVEAAHVMVPESGAEPGIFAEFRALLPGVELAKLGRAEFYEAARGPNLAVLVATGERRLFANILLTLGVVDVR